MGKLDKDIYCPICGKFVFHYKGITSTLGMNCKKCNKYISYSPSTGEISIYKAQSSRTSSGMTFF